MAKVLVTDDSLTVLKVVERLLTEAGLEVALATSGEEALAWLANQRPDLIISDVIMEETSGYDVCSFVRSHRGLEEVPVLLISGIIDEEVTRQAEICRADGVLKKPFLGASLQDRVRELLAKRNGRGDPPSASAPGAAKVYRVTKEQVQAFRQAAARIKELELRVAAEQAKSARLAQRLAEVEQASALAEECLRAATQTLGDLTTLFKEPDGRSAWETSRPVRER